MTEKRKSASMAGRDPETGQFQVGHTGIGGRPKGSRNKLTETFFTDLYGAWEDKGRSAIDAMIADKPGDFVKCVASLMPREFDLKQNQLAELSENELADLVALVRSALVTGTSPQASDGAGSGTETKTRH